MRTMLSLALLLLTAIPLRADETPGPTMPASAILVGWDGAHRDHVKKLLEDGKLPNLKKLIAEGSLRDIDVTSGATDTKAGWSQILTGYKPAVTGVYNNGRYRDIPDGYSIFERLRAKYGAANIATVAVIGKKFHCGEVAAPFKRPYNPNKDVPAAQMQGKKKQNGKGQGKAKQPGAKKQQKLGHVVEENGQKFLVFEGSPYYTMHNNVDQWHFGLMEDAKVGDKAIAMLDKYAKKPFFFFVHFAEVDHQGHTFGEGSAEYDAAIVSNDAQLGRIMEKLHELGLADKTRIYVTADHGFDIGQKAHKNAPYVFLATNDKAVSRGGCRADIAPTILDRLGVDLSVLRPALDGETLTRGPTKPIGKVDENPDIKKPKAKQGQAKKANPKKKQNAAAAKKKGKNKAGQNQGKKKNPGKKKGGKKNPGQKKKANKPATLQSTAS